MFAVVLDSGPSHKQLNAPRGSETCKSAELFGFSVLANTQYGEKCCGKAVATSQSTWKLGFKGNGHYLVETNQNMSRACLSLHLYGVAGGSVNQTRHYGILVWSQQRQKRFTKSPKENGVI